MSKKVQARILRKNMTEAEKKLWNYLRFKQVGHYKFRRQSPVGRYIVDFVCFEQKLIIELDGGHHADQVDRDAKRSHWLREQGFQILRFWNHEVLGEIEAVIQIIMNALPPHLSSPTRGEEEEVETPHGSSH